MFDDLLGKRVLVTGSTAGIGLAVAKLFVQCGAKVAINSRSQNDAANHALGELFALGKEEDILFIPADLTKSEECKKMVEVFVNKFGGMDVLINNAGGLGGRASLERIDDVFYDHVMDLNARSVLMTTKYSIPYLRASAAESGETACVISTGSIAGREGGGLGAGVYAASKAWLHNIHRNWVKEYTKEGIRFNIVSPGTVDTLFHADKSDELKGKIADSIAFGRFAESEELAPSFAFFASHKCSGYITGQILDVNGGQMCP